MPAGSEQPPPDMPVEKPSSEADTTSKAQSVVAPGPPPSTPEPQLAPTRRRYKYLPWLLVLAIIMCVAVVAVGVWIVNPGNILSKATETPTPTLTATATLALPTDTLAPLPTFTATLLSATETEPAATDTEVPELITPTDTELSPPVYTIIDDEFDTSLALNWRAWGKPRPVIDQGFGDNFLSLKSINPADAGVTSKADFILQSGVDMGFGAQLQPGYSNFMLIFSWDPDPYVRDVGQDDPGLLQVEISQDEIVIKAALTNERCVGSVRGTDAHNYKLSVLDSNRVDLFIDDGGEPVCSLVDIGMQAPIAGRITFRAMGLVSYVLVTGP